MVRATAFCPSEINPRDAGILCNFARQNGVVEHQLDVGFQAAPPVSSATRASRNGVLSLPIRPALRLLPLPDQSQR